MLHDETLEAKLEVKRSKDCSSYTHEEEGQ